MPSYPYIQHILQKYYNTYRYLLISRQHTLVFTQLLLRMIVQSLLPPVLVKTKALSHSAILFCVANQHSVSRSNIVFFNKRTLLAISSGIHIAVLSGGRWNFKYALCNKRRTIRMLTVVCHNIPARFSFCYRMFLRQNVRNRQRIKWTNPSRHPFHPHLISSYWLKLVPIDVK